MFHLTNKEFVVDVKMHLISNKHEALYLLTCNGQGQCSFAANIFNKIQALRFANLSIKDNYVHK